MFGLKQRQVAAWTPHFPCYTDRVLSALRKRASGGETRARRHRIFGQAQPADFRSRV